MRFRPLFALLLAAALCAVVYVLFFTDGSTGGSGGVVDREIAPVDRRESVAHDVRLADAAGDSGEGRRVEETVDGSELDFGATPHPWADMLSGVTGRVVEDDGTPVVAIRVELLEGDISVLFESDFTAMGREDLAVCESETDAEGRFFIEGAMFSGLHVFAIDSGAGRSTLRVLEHGLEPGELTDVGDIVLADCGTVIGTVLDEDGEPVPGARVRIAPIPELALQSGILDLREECMVAGGEDDEALGIKLPSFLMSNMKRLPIPTTTTAADGTFRLEGVPLTTVSGGVDKAGFVATIIPTFTLDVEEYSVGELDLEVGRTIVGRVVDTLGEPVAGAEICAGALHPLFPVGILQPAEPTAKDGTFQVPGISDLGRAIASARRSGRESWTTALGTNASASVEIVLAAAAPLTVRAMDVAGEPVTGARVRLSEKGGGSSEIPSAVLSMFQIRSRAPRPQVDEREPGVYVIDELGLGEWIVRVESELHAPAEKAITHSSEATLCELICKGARTIDVLVVDAATGAPVEKAFLRVAGQSDRLLGGFAAAFTDVEGRAALGPLPLPGDVSLNEGMGGFELEPFLTAEHPAYGSEASLLPKGGDQVRLELSPACTLTGIVSWAGVAPPEPYMISLIRTGGGGELGMDGGDPTLMLSMMMSTPRSTLTNLSGAFRFPGLTAGKYELMVMRRFLDSDPFEFILGQQEPEMVMSQPVEVVEGEPNHVEIELEPDGDPPKVRFTGSVAVEDEAIANALVTINGKDVKQELTTDGLGRFESEPVAVSTRYSIRIEGEAPDHNGKVKRRRLLQTSRRPTATGENRIDVDIHYERIVVEVVDAATGDGIKDAVVTASGVEVGGSAGTDADGLATLVLDSGGARRRGLSVSHKSYRTASERTRIDPADPPPHARFELVRSVPCAGRAILPGDMASAERKGMSIRQVDGGGERKWHQFDDEELTFVISGLLPGTYKASAWAGRKRTKSLEFELGHAGDENLVLQFETRN